MGSDPTALIAGFGVVFLAADDGRHGREPWWADSTTGRSRLLRDMNQVPDPTVSSDPTGNAVTNDALYMSLDDGVHGREPWHFENDVVFDLMSGPEGSDPHDFTEMHWSTWFVADAADGSGVLHACLGGCDQPVRIAVDGDLVRGVSALAAADERLYFVATGGTGEPTLGWASETWTRKRPSPYMQTEDAATTVLTAPPPSSDPPPEGPFSQLTIFRDRLFLAVDEATTGTELWSSDGTPEGTAPVLDVPRADLDPRNLVPVRKHLWFSADPDDGTGREPWLTDGAAEGTRPVADIALDGDSNPSGFTGFRGAVAFTAEDTKHGRELWLSDGTEEGTRLVMDIRPGPAGSEPTDLAVLGRAR